MRLITGNLSQIREVQGGSGHNGQNSPPLEFGVGSAPTVDSVIIRWPNGTIQTMTQVAANQILEVWESPPSTVRHESELPQQFVLEQNYPNPFNPSTVIRYQLSVISWVSLKVYDLLGQELATLVNEGLKPGNYTVQLDASGLASGVYFYRLRAGSFAETRKLVLLR